MTNDFLLSNTKIHNADISRSCEYGSQPISSFTSETLVGGLDVIENLEPEWTVLCNEGASNEPFLRPEWFAAFVANFDTKAKLLIVRRNGRLRAVLPLMTTRETLHGIPANKLNAIFNLQTPRFDLVHGDDDSERDEILNSLWNEIKRQPKWDLVEMRLVRKDSWLNDLLILAEKEKYKTGIWDMDSAPFIELPTGENNEQLISNFTKGLKKHFRQELKRRWNRLSELGKVDFVVSREYSSELMETYFELEANSWKGREGTAATSDIRSRKLHEDFACSVSAKNALYFYELKLDQKTIAMGINIMYRDKTTFWKTSFDEKFARYAPGNLLIREFLFDCIKENSVELDMLSPAAEYKKVWTTSEREHVAFYIFNNGLKGSLLWSWKFKLIRYLRNYTTR